MALAVAIGPEKVHAQGGGDGSVLAGAALGVYSGAMLGLVGSLLPCERTVLGRRCAAFAGVTGGAIGLASGGALGVEGGDPVRDRGRGALYGLLIGGAAGAVLQRAVRQYAWNDALLVAAYGAAVGAAPRGALIGGAAGAVVGGLLWASPRGGLADFIMLTTVGSALGGLYDWVDGAVDVSGAGAPTLVSSFSVAVG